MATAGEGAAGSDSGSDLMPLQGDVNRDGEIGFLEAVSIGIGGMVGGGIFAVLGIAVSHAGRLAWASFLVGGVIAILTTYAFWRLGLAYPSQGGATEYLNRVFGVNLLTGGLNWLLWLGYMLMVAVYSVAFGAYGAALFGVPHDALVAKGLSSLVVIAFTLVNVLGAGEAGRIEDIIVGIKVLILLVFVAAGSFLVNPAEATNFSAEGPVGILFAAGLIFLAYEGFELIANTAEDLQDPQRTLPRALMTSVLFVIALYVAIAFIVGGTLDPAVVVQAKEYALAAAARPALGQFGFQLVSIAAVLSTASAINSTLYGTQRFTFVMAVDNQLPVAFERSFRGKHLVGLVATGAIAVAVADLLPLANIALLSSGVFLAIFGAVNLAAYRDRRNIGAHAWIPVVAFLACLASFAAVVDLAWTSGPDQILLLVAVVAVSFLIEWAYRRFFPEHPQPPGTADL